MVISVGKLIERSLSGARNCFGSECIIIFVAVQMSYMYKPKYELSFINNYGTFHSFIFCTCFIHSLFKETILVNINKASSQLACTEILFAVPRRRGAQYLIRWLHVYGRMRIVALERNKVPSCLICFLIKYWVFSVKSKSILPLVATIANTSLLSLFGKQNTDFLWNLG